MSEQTDWQRLLAALSDGQPHSHRDLYRLGLMAHSRCSDLRKRGYEVEVRRDGRDYMYQLTGSPADPPAGVAAAAPEAAAADQLTLGVPAVAAQKPDWA